MSYLLGLVQYSCRVLNNSVVRCSRKMQVILQVLLIGSLPIFYVAKAQVSLVVVYAKNSYCSISIDRQDDGHGADH